MPYANNANTLIFSPSHQESMAVVVALRKQLGGEFRLSHALGLCYPGSFEALKSSSDPKKLKKPAAAFLRSEPL